MGYTLVLLRHGQSSWNLENRFTGWIDVPLSELGKEEAVTAGRQLEQAGIRPDIVHTSLLLRATDTAQIALAEMGLSWLPVRRSWRLNERHYGALQGLNKAETAARHGEEQVKVWRRSYDIRPPALSPGDPNNPAADLRYKDLAPDLKPATECLKDVVERMLPWWYDAIVPDLRDGRCVLVSAHGNSLRGLVKHLDGVSDEEIVEFNIPTGIPRVYQLDQDLRVRSVDYLGDPAEIAAKAQAVAEQASGKVS
jgi:2,3-bisphosphoglycerate-dependent phosphoglycerate mutase